MLDLYWRTFVLSIHWAVHQEYPQTRFSSTVSCVCAMKSVQVLLTSVKLNRKWCLRFAHTGGALAFQSFHCLLKTVHKKKKIIRISLALLHPCFIWTILKCGSKVVRNPYRWAIVKSMTRQFVYRPVFFHFLFVKGSNMSQYKTCSSNMLVYAPTIKFLGCSM